MKDSPPEQPALMSVGWTKVIVIASILAIPISYGVYADLSGENHFGQGLEHSFYRAVFWAVQLLAFSGLILSPCLKLQSERRQGLLMVVAVLAFLADEALSIMFIAVASFPD